MSQATARADVAAESPRATDNYGDGRGLSLGESRPAVITGPSGISTTAASTSSSTTETLKIRSCVVCRSRKVRCDKKSPCSNCIRANIACVLPSTNRPPRWARRLQHSTHNAVAGEKSAQAAEPATSEVLEKLKNLENLVKELSDQLEQARAVTNSFSGNSLANLTTHDRDNENSNSPTAIPSSGNVQSQFGRLVLNDGSQSRYVSSGFWSRVNDEVDMLSLLFLNSTGH